MPKLEQIPTAEEITAAKEQMNKPLRDAGKPEKPVWCQKFAEGSIQFLHTWITADRYAELQAQYMRAAQKDVANAERWLQINILQDAVLWPEEFDPSAPDSLQPYPAGVLTGLVNAIMTRSEVNVPGLPEVLLSPPSGYAEPDEAEIAAAEKATTFGTFEKSFFVANYNPQTDNYDPIPSRFYLYTCVSESVYRNAMEKAKTDGEDAGETYIVEKCVLWPAKIDWSTEPAGYKDALYTAIMAQTGFSPDPTTESEEV